MKTAGTLLVLSLLAGSLAGCATYTKPLAPPVELAPAEMNFQAVWDASLEVLRGYNFALDEQDRRRGLITTLPLTGRHWFEFWRPDAATPSDVAEGTLQTIYRAATVRVRPVAEGAATYAATVEVETARSERKELQIVSPSEALRMFRLTGRYHRFVSEEEEAEKEARLLVEDEQAVPGRPRLRLLAAARVGRDANLEARLTSEIAALAARKLTVR